MIKIDTWGMFKTMFDVFIAFWPLWVILVIILLTRIFFERWLPSYLHKRKTEKNFKNGEKWRSDRDLIYWLRGMPPNKFEEYVAHLFSKLGYKTEAVGGSYDGGIDVIAEKDGIKHYIQCKKFITSEVGVGAIRDFYGAVAGRLSSGKGYFITTNKFTLEAEKFAEDKPIELIDSYRLIEYIRLAEKNSDNVLQNSDEKCSECGGDMIKRTGKFGEFYGCSNYPKCKFTKEIVS